VAVTPAAYTQFNFVAPVDPRLPGGGGYALTNLYDITPAFLGHFQNVTSSDYPTVSEVYNGVDLTISGRFASSGFISGGMNVGHTIYNDCGVLLGNPQITESLNTSHFFLAPSRAGIPLTAPFCNGYTPWLSQFKFQGSYEIPWNVRASFTFQDLPGIPIQAIMNATNAQVQPYLGRPLSAGLTATIPIQLIAPNTMYEPRLAQADIRLSRIFSVNKTRIQALFDIYNAFNASTILARSTPRIVQRAR
jgi:hypothetical protein